jgi:predicted small metal-binding protein
VGSAADTWPSNSCEARRGSRCGSSIEVQNQERSGNMSKEFRCGDIMPGCPTMIEGKDDKEVMAKTSEHAKNAHNMPTIPPGDATKVQKAIHAK